MPEHWDPYLQKFIQEGASGSGNFGHAGRPGERGGSGEGDSGNSMASTSKQFKDYGEVWDAIKQGRLKTNIMVKVKAYGGVKVKVVDLQPPYGLNAVGMPIKQKIVEV